MIYKLLPIKVSPLALLHILLPLIAFLFRKRSETEPVISGVYVRETILQQVPGLLHGTLPPNKVIEWAAIAKAFAMRRLFVYIVHAAVQRSNIRYLALVSATDKCNF